MPQRCEIKDQVRFVNTVNNAGWTASVLIPRKMCMYEPVIRHHLLHAVRKTGFTNGIPVYL